MATNRRRPHMQPFEVNPERAQAYGIKPPPPVRPNERYLKPVEAAKCLNVSLGCARLWLHRGALRGQRLSNGFWKIKVSDLSAFISSRRKFGRKRVLIFCAKAVRQQAIVKVVESAGHAAVTASNALDGMLKMKNSGPSVFLIDVSASGGWKLAGQARSTWNGKTAALILLPSRPLTESDERKAFALNASGFLPATMSGGQVAAKIGRVLE